MTQIVFLRRWKDHYSEALSGEFLRRTLDPAKFRAFNLAVCGAGAKPPSLEDLASGAQESSDWLGEWRRNPPQAFVFLDPCIDFREDEPPSAGWRVIRELTARYGVPHFAVDLYPVRESEKYSRFKEVFLMAPFAKPEDETGATRRFRLAVPTAPVDGNPFLKKIKRIRDHGGKPVIYLMGGWQRQALFRWLDQYMLHMLESSLPESARLILVRGGDQPVRLPWRQEHLIAPQTLACDEFNALLSMGSLCISVNHASFSLKRAAALGTPTLSCILPRSKKAQFMAWVQARGGTIDIEEDRLRLAFGALDNLNRLRRKNAASELPAHYSSMHRVVNLLDEAAFRREAESLVHREGGADDGWAQGEGSLPGFPAVLESALSRC